MKSVPFASVVLFMSAAAFGLESGLAKDDHIPLFEPTHIAGRMKGTNDCPT